MDWVDSRSSLVKRERDGSMYSQACVSTQSEVRAQPAVIVTTEKVVVGSGGAHPCFGHCRKRETVRALPLLGRVERWSPRGAPRERKEPRRSPKTTSEGCSQEQCGTSDQVTETSPAFRPEEAPSSDHLLTNT